MFSRLMPREAKFFDLFSAHADLVVKGGRQLVVLVHDLGKGPEVLAQHLTPEALPALEDFIAGLKDVAWEVPAIGALIKASIGKHGLKMPRLAMPLRVLLTGQAQTPSVDAVIALFPRELVLKRLAAAPTK